LHRGNRRSLDSRLDLAQEPDKQDLGWARGRLVRWGIAAVIRFADLCRWGDDVIVYARK
jgi:hypothetical protein